jgi:sigma-B regulation protein RsbU (phosphoserine phosphatase)
MDKKRILLVEDSPAIREMVKDALRDLLEFQPDLIITDIMMPKVNGLEMCEAMKNRLETRSIPFILFSSRFDDDTLKRGRAIGAKFFIAKPFEMSTLLSCVEKIFGEAA